MKLFLFILLCVVSSMSQQLSLNIPNDASNVKLSIYSLNGRLIHSTSGKVTNGTNWLLPTELGGQMLIMRISVDNSEYTRKVTGCNSIVFSNPQAKMVITSPRSLDSTIAETVDSASLDSIFFSKSRAANAISSRAVEPLQPANGDKKTCIYFVNGIWTGETRAEAVHEEIKDAYKYRMIPDLFPSTTCRYSYVYNVSQPLGLPDLLECTYSKIGEVFEDESMSTPLKHLIFMTLLLGSDEYLLYSYLSQYINAESKLDIIRRWLSEKIVSTIAWPATSNQTIAHKIADALSTSISNKERAIVMVHSQGNLLVNDAQSFLTSEQKRHIGTISIATPASWAPGVYISGKEDMVINAVRVLFPSTLPSTEISLIDPVNDSYNGLDGIKYNWPFHHDILTSYFHPNLTSRAFIDDAFYKYYRDLPYWDEEKELFFQAKWASSAARTDLYYVRADGVRQNLGQLWGEATYSSAPISLGIVSVDNAKFKMESFWRNNWYYLGPTTINNTKYFRKSQLDENTWSITYEDAVGYDWDMRDGNFILYYK